MPSNGVRIGQYDSSHPDRRYKTIMWEGGGPVSFGVIIINKGRRGRSKTRK